MRRRRDPSVPLVPDERGERHEFIPAESGHPGKSPSCCAIRGDTPAGRRGKGRDQHPGHSVGPRRGDRKERRRPGCYDGSERALLLRFPREVEAGGPTGVAERKYTSFPVQSEFLRPVRDSRAIPEDIKFVLQDLIIQYYIFTYHFSISGCHGLSTVDGLSRFVRGASARNGNDAGPRVVPCASCSPIAPPPRPVSAIRTRSRQLRGALGFFSRSRAPSSTFWLCARKLSTVFSSFHAASLGIE